MANEERELDDDLQLPEPAPATAQPASPTPAARASTRALDPSPTARQLIKIRDKVLMSTSADAAPGPELLEAIYRDLARALELEGVTPIEDTGAFDHDRHLIVDTRATDDAGLESGIFATIRPGYLFDGRVVRMQEVIVYSASGARPEPSGE